MKTGIHFWQAVSGVYELVIRKDASVYTTMYEYMRERVDGKKVLELATGTGLIARNIAASAKCVLAADFSPLMIARAKKKSNSANLTFEVRDACALPYESRSFDIVIISNTLHVMPNPERALAEIERVLADDGLLIAPTFTHGEMVFFAKVQSFVMRVLGFPLGNAWTPESYTAFLGSCGFRTIRKELLPASFPLMYVECEKSSSF